MTNNRAFSSRNLCFGGAIFTENGWYNLNVSTTTFTWASINLINTIFSNNRALTNGGAIVAFFIHIKMLKCGFTTNSAMIGGVLTVTKCNITIYDSYFNFNVAHSTNGGGMIYTNGESVISITKTRFYNNIAALGDGGVLCVNTLTNITVTESNFYNNSALLKGGVIFMNEACNLNILGCQFNNNKASKGGVIAAEFHSGVGISDSDFNNNVAYERGGAVSIYDDTTVIVENTSFRDNTASIGATLTQDQNTVTIINNCSFHRNIASVAGGVFVSLIQSHTQLMSSEFNGNRAVRAGGVGMAELQCNVFIIDSSGFNNTSQLGGAVYVTDGCLMYVERCQINGCKVSSLERLNASGGAFAVTDSSELIIKDCEFYNNTALFSGGVAFLSINHMRILITLSSASILH